MVSVRLSQAEQAVSQLALEGLSNAAIAGARNSSPRTVANQLAAAYRKLGVNSRRELRALGDLEREAPRHHHALATLLELQQVSALTTREQQVLARATSGESNKLIAYSLGLSLSSVSTHLARARRKLGRMVR